MNERLSRPRFWRTFLLMAAACTAFAGTAAAEPANADALFAAKLTDLDDRPATLAGWKGRAFVVNFWARWCAPCRKELPEFVKARARHRDSGVDMLGLALEERGAPVREFAKTYAIDYATLLLKDDAMKIMAALGNAQLGLPFTLAVDRRGKIVYLKLGPMSAADMDAAFAAASQR